MASRFFAKRQVIAYLPSLRSVVNRVRLLSSHNVLPPEPLTVWPDEKLGPFGPQDKRFPLPGNTGHSTSLAPTVPKEKIDPLKLLQSESEQRQLNVMYQLHHIVEQENEGYVPDMPNPKPDDYLECVAQECPDTLKKDFQALFIELNDMYATFTIITMSQKTRNDMTGWSMDVEEEREELLQAFIQGAIEICEALIKKGYWADFIDPSCGKPYLGSHTNTTFFETDERYRKLGFEIEDLGCCKVIRHHQWGTHCYVGCLFTNAPLQDSLIQTMVNTESEEN